MAAAPVKSQPLHNFTLPSFLKWGGGKSHGSASQSRHRRSLADDSEAESERNESESELRAGQIGSRATRNRFSLSPCDATERRRSQVEEERAIVVAEEAPAKMSEGGGDEGEETAQKPWNLRPRRGMSSSKAPGFHRNGESQITMSPARSIVAALQVENHPKSLRRRGLCETTAGEKKEKRKFWIALSREEIEEDIFVMTGSRPARRPKKRPKNVQKQLDIVFPGLWLVGATADDFRGAENSSKK